LTKPKDGCIIVLMKKEQIRVIWKDASGVASEREFDNLTPAMDWAKTLAVFVTIKSNQYEIVGKFGVDSIEDGKCPDGVVYDWNKASRIGATKRS
jgi:hypothetical protein